MQPSKSDPPAAERKRKGEENLEKNAEGGSVKELD